MTATVQKLIDSFEALAPAEKHEALVEILRRFRTSAEGDLSDDVLSGLAEELFATLDREEGDDAPR
jgi:hypothetical protein